MKKLLITLLLALLCVLGGTAIVLAESDDWNDGNNRWWTPYDGIVKNQLDIYGTAMDLVEFYSTKWSASSISQFTWQDAWELEWRGADGGSVQWGDLVNLTPISTYSNLPGAYFENNDYDDATFGCWNPESLVADRSYQGYMRFSPKSTQPSSFNLTVESEWGKDYGLQVDPIPQYFDIVKRYMSRDSLYNW